MSLYHLAQIRRRKGDDQAAERLYQQALAIFSERFGTEHERVHVVGRELVALYEAGGKPERAAQYRRLLAGSSRNDAGSTAVAPH